MIDYQIIHSCLTSNTPTHSYNTHHNTLTTKAAIEWFADLSPTARSTWLAGNSSRETPHLIPVEIESLGEDAIVWQAEQIGWDGIAKGIIVFSFLSFYRPKLCTTW